MKFKIFFLSLLAIAWIPAAAHAQYMGGPGGEATPFFEPLRYGWVHEGGMGAAYLTGDGRDQYIGGFGVYYSGLLRIQPNLAFGVHVAGGLMDLGTVNDVEQSMNYQLVGGEARVYVPAGMVDFWANVVLGGGRLDKVATAPDGFQEVAETLGGAVLGFGVGGEFYLTPNMSVGAHLRMYRLYPKDEEVTGEMSNAQFVGMWMTVGVNAALHY